MQYVILILNYSNLIIEKETCEKMKNLMLIKIAKMMFRNACRVIHYFIVLTASNEKSVIKR